MCSSSGVIAPDKGPAIGIDLGTWKCCVGVVRKGKVEIIKNERGSKTTPSYVAFTETERLVGEDAKDQVALNPTNTVYGVKRIIGRRFDDPDSKHHLVNFPFKTKKQYGPGGIEILVRYKGTEKWLPPMHITTMMLRKMKLTAEAYLGCPVQEAVVSVPACFNSAQRQATLDAAEIAGLKVLQLLHEPTAVALAYKDQAGCGALNQTVMVVDAGGGTMEVSIVSIKKNVLKVLATSSDDHLGGLDIDQLLVDECVKKFQSGYDCEPSKNRKAIERLRLACQKAKNSLTLLHDTVIFVDSFIDRKDLNIPISREQFSRLFSKRADEIIDGILNDVFLGANLSLRDIDEVIVVGGSARVPSVLNKLQKMLPAKKLNTSVNADEAVAHGAALQAALLAGDNTVGDTQIFDVIPRNFYLVHKHFWFSKNTWVVFRRNWTFPTSRDWNVSIDTEGRQTLHLYEEEGKITSNKSNSGLINTYIFQHERSLIPGRRVPVRFRIDENCLFRAPLHPTGEHSRMKIHRILSLENSLAKIMEDEKSFQRDEQAEQERMRALSKLESSCFEIKTVVKKWKILLEGHRHLNDFWRKCESLLKACDHTVGLIDDYPNVVIGKLMKWQTQLDQRYNTMTDFLRSTHRSDEDITKNVPCSPRSNCSLSSRETLQENSALQFSVTATLADKTRQRSRSNLLLLHTGSVKETKLFKTDNSYAWSETLSSAFKSVSSLKFEPSMNGTIVVDKIYLDAEKTNSSNETKSYATEQGALPKTELPKLATYLENACLRKSAMGNKPHKANFAEIEKIYIEMAVNEHLHERTSHVAIPFHALSEKQTDVIVSGVPPGVKLEITNKTVSPHDEFRYSKTNGSTIRVHDRGSTACRSLPVGAGTQPSAAVHQVTAGEKPSAAIHQATAGQQPSPVFHQATAGEQPSGATHQATAGEQPSSVIHQATDCKQSSSAIHQATAIEQPLGATHQAITDEQPYTVILRTTAGVQPSGATHPAIAGAQLSALIHQATANEQPPTNIHQATAGEQFSRSSNHAAVGKHPFTTIHQVTAGEQPSCACHQAIAAKQPSGTFHQATGGEHPPGASHPATSGEQPSGTYRQATAGEQASKADHQTVVVEQDFGAVHPTPVSEQDPGADRVFFNSNYSSLSVSNGGLRTRVSEAILQIKGETKKTRECLSLTAKIWGNTSFKEKLVCIRTELEDCQSRIYETQEEFPPSEEVIKIDDTILNSYSINNDEYARSCIDRKEACDSKNHALNNVITKHKERSSGAACNRVADCVAGGREDGRTRWLVRTGSHGTSKDSEEQSKTSGNTDATQSNEQLVDARSGTEGARESVEQASSISDVGTAASEVNASPKCRQFPTGIERPLAASQLNSPEELLDRLKAIFTTMHLLKMRLGNSYVGDEQRKSEKVSSETNTTAIRQDSEVRKIYHIDRSIQVIKDMKTMIGRGKTEVMRKEDEVSCKSVLASVNQEPNGEEQQSAINSFSHCCMQKPGTDKKELLVDGTSKDDELNANNSIDGANLPDNTANNKELADRANRGRGTRIYEAAGKFCFQLDEGIPQHAGRATDEDDVAEVCDLEQNEDQHQQRSVETTCTDKPGTDAAKQAKIFKTMAARHRAGGNQRTHSEVRSNTRMVTGPVAEMFMKEGNKRLGIATQETNYTSNVRIADDGSKTPNAATISNTSTRSNLDRNEDLLKTKIPKKSLIGSSRNANELEKISRTSRPNLDGSPFTPEGIEAKKSKHAATLNIWEGALQTGQNHERKTQTHAKLELAQTQERDAEVHQQEVQSQQQEVQSQQQEVQSHQQEYQFHHLDARSQQQEALSQQQIISFQQQDAQSQQQEAQFQQHDALPQQQDSQSQQKKAPSQQQGSSSQQQDAQFQQQETVSQQQDAQSQPLKAQFQHHVPQSLQEEAQSQQHEVHSPQEVAQSQQHASQSQEQKAPSQQQETLPQQQEAQYQQRKASTQNSIPPEADERPVQQESQPVVNGSRLSMKSKSAPTRPLGKPYQRNKRPEQRHNPPDQQQPCRAHVMSQQNASSTHQRKSPAIGIDLGTWKCCVGVVREGKVDIIENERGSKTTPSYVAFTETERLVGEDAKDQVALNPTNTVFGVKRIIGRRFGDQSLQSDMKLWSFTVTPDKHDRPRIQVRYQKGEKVLSPEQVSAMMLEKMKRIAETHLGCDVRDAVISVPAYFNNAQRQATKDAGAIAGLNVLGLINEPTAAALAYRDNKARVEPHNVLIFDLGGGTFDVAVIRVDESGVKVKGVCGDAEFGGNEMDVLLMKHFEEKFIENHGKSVFRDRKGLERLRTASEMAKKTLTLLPEANVQVDSLIGDIDFNTFIKRHDFEQLIYAHAKEKIEAVLTSVLQQATIKRFEIDEVVLIGGTSRIPKIQSILKEFFCSKALNKTVNPDEAVAHGAALYAALLAGDCKVKEVHVTELVQDPLKNYFGVPVTTFQKYQNVPSDKELLIKQRFNKTQLIEDFVDLYFRLDPFGVFEVYSQSAKCFKDINRIPLAECLTEIEATQLAAQVRQFAQDDQELKEGVAAMSDLEALCFQTKALMTSNSLRRKLGQDELGGIADRCEEMICWLDDNDSATKTEYQYKKRQLCCRILSAMEKGDVKMEDFYETEHEWFRKILKSQSENPTRKGSSQQNPSHQLRHETPTSTTEQEPPEPAEQPTQLPSMPTNELHFTSCRQKSSPLLLEQLDLTRVATLQAQASEQPKKRTLQTPDEFSPCKRASESEGTPPFELQDCQNFADVSSSN